MGGASTPFRYFTSHPEPELAAAVVEGRRREFAEHGWDTGDVPDPQDPETFRSSVLNRAERTDPGHARLYACYRDLLALRRSRAELTDPWLENLQVDYDEGERWIVVHRGGIRVACNLGGAEPITVPVGGVPLVWWEEPVVNRTRSAALIPGHSFAVLDGDPGR